MRNNFKTTLALVVKCQKNKEKDSLVTLVTQEHGKILVAAKGVRQLKSSKKAYLQTGNLIKAHFVLTKGLPILTQAQLIGDASNIRCDLAQIRKFLLFIEIIDRLLVNEELSASLFQKIIYLHQLFLHQVSNITIKKHFLEILMILGYLDCQDEKSSIISQVNQILGTDLCTFKYLSLNPHYF